MARVEVPASDFAWPLLDAHVRRLTGATRVLVVHIVAPSGTAVAPGAPAESRVAEWLASPDLISVAALTTAASGAAFALALACDLRVLADDVTLDAGGAAFLGGVGPLVDRVGPARALELCLTGRRITAAEAAAVGLATVSVARDQVDDTVADLVAAVLATPHPLATEIKALVSEAAGTVAPARRLAAEYAASERLARGGA